MGLFRMFPTDGLVDANIATADAIKTVSICRLEPSRTLEPIQQTKSTSPPTTRVRSETGNFIILSS